MWKKILTNIALAGAGSAAPMAATGQSPEQAAVVAGASVIANVIGLMQKSPAEGGGLKQVLFNAAGSYVASFGAMWAAGMPPKAAAAAAAMALLANLAGLTQKQPQAAPATKGN